MIRFVFFISAALLGFSLKAQEVNQNFEPCSVLKVAFENDQRWFLELQEFCGGKVVLGDHGFDLTCLAQNRNVVLLPKAKIGKAPHILLYSIHDTDENLTIHFVRISNGISSRMESKVIAK